MVLPLEAPKTEAQLEFEATLAQQSASTVFVSSDKVIEKVAETVARLVEPIIIKSGS